jgi:hypothetical protein
LNCADFLQSLSEVRSKIPSSSLAAGSASATDYSTTKTIPSLLDLVIPCRFPKPVNSQPSTAVADCSKTPPDSCSKSKNSPLTTESNSTRGKLLSPGRFLEKVAGTSKHCSLVTLSSDASIPFITDGEGLPQESQQPLQVVLVTSIAVGDLIQP